MSAPFARRLARWRVPLGFVSALVVLVLARPTPPTLAAGVGIAILGEWVRLWAAGHLEKSREVTTSGPYRYTRHPLYVGSTIMGIGLVVAASHWAVAAIVGAYLAVTFTAAIKSEEAFLRERFGNEYDAYAAGAVRNIERRFSLARAVRNREYRAVAGMIAIVGVLVLKTYWPS